MVVGEAKMNFLGFKTSRGERGGGNPDRKKLRWLAPTLAAAFGMAAFLSFENSAAAQTATSGNHNLVNTMRSGTVSHMFVSQSLDLEFGNFSGKVDHGKSADAVAGLESLGPSSDKWRGFGIGTNFGLEVFKFIQFTGGHTYVSMRRNDDGLQTLSGSRFNAGARFVFLAPLANLELGGGILASRMDFVQRLQRAEFYGTGLYYSVGMNYFLTSQVSVFGTVKTIQESFVRGSGDSTFEAIKNQTTTVGTGFSIWL